MMTMILGPNGGHPFRTLGIGQRPFLDSSFSSHLRDLESIRRKAAPITSVPTAPISNPTSTTNGLINSDCQGYKPNAPQIQGKHHGTVLLTNFVNGNSSNFQYVMKQND